MAQSAFGGHRVIPDRWKGMSPAQVQEIRATQEMQKHEKEVCLLHVHTEVHYSNNIHKAQSCNVNHNIIIRFHVQCMQI